MTHAMDCKLILALAALAVVGCGKSPDDGSSGSTDGNAASAVTDSSAGSTAAPVAPSAHSPLAGGAATWSNLPSGPAWTAATLGAVAENLVSLEKAADKETYCPGYSKATLAQRETCWIRLVSAVAQFESGFDPMNKYKESNGAYSVGLLQLSTGECANAETLSELEDGAKNLVCGTRKMADLIARYGYITSPDNTHGAAAYWSTLRRPYVSGKLHLGKALDVQKITKIFLGVAAVEPEAELALAP